MTIEYQTGNVIGIATFYTTENKPTWREPSAIEQEKIQNKLFKILNTKKLKATYNIK